MDPKHGQTRAVVRDVYPALEGGRYPIKRVSGEEIKVWADVIADGHDVLNASLRYKHSSSRTWSEVPAHPIGDDRWHTSFRVEKQGWYSYQFCGWVDYALNWQYGIRKKSEAGIRVETELLEGLEFLEALKKQVKGKDLEFVKACISEFALSGKYEEAVRAACSPKLEELFRQFPYRPFIATNEQELKVWVDREKAAFSTWYEFFPRSASSTPGKHGTFQDCIRLLTRVKDLGFDTLYFPPVHPIGRINRKGKNNATTAESGDVGSCWGIGAEEGGHTSLHPDLGSTRDFIQLIKEAEKLGIEIAMDFALQAAPDHPWVKEHPDWFKQRPDGTIQYAENPPKKYQDIYPIWFESPDWKNLWKALLDVALYWIDQGIRVFRVDNPHTKPFGFWEWLINEVHKKHPDILFLSEAFTRPKVMQELAKLGFTQSYTYFTWRNNKAELIEYLSELTRGPQSEYFRPNFWPNTPDILPWALQNPNEHTYKLRYFLAAALSGNCGVYGPVYEFMVHEALPGKEEYHDSEKYQVSHWDWDRETPVTDLYRKINRIRKEQLALQRTNNIEFLHIPNDQMLAWMKKGSDGSVVVGVVSFDAFNTQSAELNLHPSLLNKSEHDAFIAEELMTGTSYNWRGDRHFISLDPAHPYQLFRIH